MKACLVTVPFNRDLSAFDGSELVRLVEDKDPHSIREHFRAARDGTPGLACIVAWQDRPGSVSRSGSEGAARPGQLARKCAPSNERFDESGERACSVLRRWRSDRAREPGVPVFRMLTNRQLDELASLRPTSVDELARVESLGACTQARHRQEIVECVGAASKASDRAASARDGPIAEAS